MKPSLGSRFSPAALCLAPLLVFLPFSARAQDSEVLGNLRATVDGEEGTWYVIRGTAGDGSQPFSSAVWYEPEPGQLIVAVGGFDTSDLPLASFHFEDGVGFVSYGDYVGSALNVALQLTEGTPTFTVDLESTEELQSVTYVPTVSELATGYVSASGSITVSSWSRDGETVSVTGSFSSSVELVGGGGTRLIEVTGGTFEASGIPNVEAVTGGR